MTEGRTIAALPSGDDATATRPRCSSRPAGGAAGPGARRDRSGTGSPGGPVEHLCRARWFAALKAYRRLQPGLNPDLEMTAFLSEEAAFPAVPRLAGFAEVISQRDGATTVAMLQEFSSTTSRRLRDDRRNAGRLAAGARRGRPRVRDGYRCRSRDVDRWTPRCGQRRSRSARDGAARRPATTCVAGRPVPTSIDDRPRRRIRRGRPGRARPRATAESITVIDALPTAPEIVRAHGDYHLGQV